MASVAAAERDPGSWTELGPHRGGMISGIVVNPTNENELLVASPGGGVWYTNNNGSTWTSRGSYLADHTVVHLEWDAVVPGRVLAATQSDLYASTNWGVTWTNLTGYGGYPPPAQPPFHVRDPEPFAQLPTGGGGRTLFFSRAREGFLYSTDGSTFTQFYPFAGGSGNEENAIQSIAANQPSAEVMVATMAGWDQPSGQNHVFGCIWTGSPCPEGTWSSRNGGLPSGFTTPPVLTSVASSPRFATAAFSAGRTRTYFFRDPPPPTPCPGVNWCEGGALPPPPATGQYRNIVYAGATQYFLGDVRSFFTLDPWSAWTEFHEVFQHVDVRSFHLNSSLGYVWAGNDGAANSGLQTNLARFPWTVGSAPNEMFATSVPVSTTNGSITGLPITQIYHAGLTSLLGSVPGRMFVGTQDNESLCSDDWGRTWVTAGTPADCGDCVSVVYAPSNPSRAYYRGSGGSTWSRSNNALSAATCADVSWSPFATGDRALPYHWTNSATAVHPSDPDYVVFATQLGVSVSTTGGASFVDYVLPGGATPSCAFVDTSGAIYIGTEYQGVFRSTTGGATWTSWGPGTSPLPRAVSAVAWSPSGGGEGTFYLATTDGLFRKLPGGAWSLVDGGGGYAVSDVEVDPNCPTRVYAAFGYRVFDGQHRGGIDVSTDNGTNWSNITAGLDLHQGPIADLRVDRSDSRFMYVAAYGHGVWEYYDASLATCP